MALNQPAWCTPALLKVLLGLLALCLAGYILGPPLYWHSMEGLAAVSRSTSAAAASSSSCPACVCDCSSQPLLSIPHAFFEQYYCQNLNLGVYPFWVSFHEGGIEKMGLTQISFLGIGNPYGLRNPGSNKITSNSRITLYG
ncbi:hypothetical protein CK203_073643 [Vitis vinifera]|uniref:Uncharacterized protein n=1 Tax=Vitis vinifera TaxID=29760 RepID=A0A438DTW9_VITVI|nr:hypothetical protein CK203_073643 [Vitis vinifera]